MDVAPHQLSLSEKEKWAVSSKAGAICAEKWAVVGISAAMI
jgi:hypothetical protein